MSTDTISPTATKHADLDHDDDSESNEAESASAPLGTKARRAAMTKCLNAVDDLTDVERRLVIRSLAALFAVECP